jgi:hypothetical protein
MPHAASFRVECVTVIRDSRAHIHSSGPRPPSKSSIKAGDLTEGHVGKLVGCHDPRTGFNYGAKIVNVIRQEGGPNPGVLLRLSHPLCRAGNQRMKIALDSDSTTSYNLSK